MKNTLIFLVVLLGVSASVNAQEDKPLTGREYAVNVIATKENAIIELLDQVARLKAENDALKKYKENSWLP